MNSLIQWTPVFLAPGTSSIDWGWWSFRMIQRLCLPYLLLCSPICANIFSNGLPFYSSASVCPCFQTELFIVFPWFLSNSFSHLSKTENLTLLLPSLKPLPWLVSHVAVILYQNFMYQNHSESFVFKYTNPDPDLEHDWQEILPPEVWGHPRPFVI